MTQTAAPQCPSCSAELPEGASFCPRCGHATPTTISGGDVGYRPPDAGADAARRRELQRLLGNACELRDLIGRGGFADVFEAWDTRLKRALAVKTLRADLDISDAVLERFRREAEAIAQLRHPNVIPIYAVGGEGHVAFFTMPKIEGESLASLLKREPKLSIAECVRILRESAAALGAAHRAAMVHRDVKPENIMLDGPARHVLVMDFGIAKSMGGSQELTRTGMVMGTPHYMSPEQATADRTIDHRSDQYSLAVVGYRMLAGRLPFEGDTLQTLIYRQVSAPPAPLRDVTPDVPAELATVIEKALSKDPAERFASMDAFAEALGGAVGTGTTPQAVRRARLDNMPSRVAAMRAAVHWRSPLVLAAVAVAILGTWTALHPAVPERLQLAANRDDAVFAAKSFATSLGLTPPLRDAATFENLSGRDLVFLLRNLPGGGTSLEQRTRAGAPYWQWEVKLRPASADTGALVVRLGAANRVLAFRRVVSDTATTRTLPVPQAESIATQQLVSRGIDPGALRRLPDSVVTLKNRTDRIFRWAVPGSAVAWRTDSAYDQVAARVTGDRVSWYRESFELPRSYPDETQHMAILGLIMIVLGFVAAVLATWLLVQRARRDVLQWSLGIRFGVVMVLATIPAWAASTFAGGAFVAGFAEAANTEVTAAVPVAMSVVAKLVGAVCFMLAAVLVESLSADSRPGMFAGLTDLLRGASRWQSPELIASVVTGTCGAMLLWAADATGSVAMARTGFPWPYDVSSMVSGAVPAFVVLAHLANRIVAALFLALLQLAAFRVRPSAALAIIAPVVVLTLLEFLLPPSTSVTLAERVSFVAYVTVLPLIVWRYGVLAGGIAAALSDGVPAVMQLLKYTNASASAGLFAALVLAAPAVVAVYAYSKIRVPE